MKNPWYWECPECGNVQPAHPDTTPDQMLPCDKHVKKDGFRPGVAYGIRTLVPDYGPCGGKLVKKCRHAAESEA